MGINAEYMGRSKMKFLLSASLVLFCSSAITTGSDCTESDSFVIKNAMQSTAPYLTLDVKKNTLKGGNLMRNGKPRDNQIWRWLNCEDGSFLTTGGKFLVYDNDQLRVVGSTSGLSGTFWNYRDYSGELFNLDSGKVVSLVGWPSKKVVMIDEGVPTSTKPLWTLRDAESCRWCQFLGHFGAFLGHFGNFGSFKKS